MFTIMAEEVGQLSVKAGIAFSLACVFVLAYGYNRIHMTNHFLSDVCFGTLITYLIYSLISTAFLRGHKESLCNSANRIDVEKEGSLCPF